MKTAQDFVNLFVDSSGEPFYFIVIFLIYQAAFLMSFGQHTRSNNELAASRHMMALGAATLAWLVLMLGGLYTIIVDDSTDVLSLLERALNTSIIIWVGWAFLTADDENGDREPLTVAFALTVMVGMGLMASFTNWDTTTPFDESALANIWALLPIITAGIGVVFLVTQFSAAADIPLKILFALVVIAGHFYALFETNGIGAIRWSMFTSSALILVIIYRLVIERMRIAINEVATYAETISKPLKPIVPQSENIITAKVELLAEETGEFAPWRAYRTIGRFYSMKIGTKLTLLLLVIFLIGVIGSGIILNRVLIERAEDEVATRGLILIETMASVRSYTGTHINPMLQDELQTESEFVRESVPGYSARTVFEIFRQNEDHDDFLYKEATLNPTNPVDQADDFEQELVEEFQLDRDLEELSGFRTRDGQQVFYIARPLSVSSESCLACHSSPDTAPASLVNTYPDGGGFGWELGEVVAAQVIYVPSEEVLDSARLSFYMIIGIFVGVFSVVLITLNLVMRPTIVSPVKLLAGFARRVRDDELTEDDLKELSMAKVTKRRDELGQLSRIFNKMAQEVYKREQQLKQKLQELRIEIDVALKSDQVSDITSSEYFMNLQQRARDLRNDADNQET